MNEQKPPPPPGFTDPPPPYQATYDGVNFQHGEFRGKHRKLLVVGREVKVVYDWGSVLSVSTNKP